MSEPAIEAWISKGLALAEDIAHPTAGANGWTEPVTKAEQKFAEELATATLVVQKMDSSDPGHAAARKRLAKLQAAYLEGHSVGFVRSEEMRKLDAAGKALAADGLAAKAERIHKSNPGIGYDELRGQFSREEQQTYLDSVRGAA